MKIFVINGPNLNMLGIREKEIYGESTYDDLVSMINAKAAELGIEVTVHQSNCEGKIVDLIQSAYGNADGIIINPAAYTHTSIAILDALKAVALPCVEVHISDVEKREDFRKKSYIREYCEKSVIGEGFEGYLTALEYLAEKLK